MMKHIGELIDDVKRTEVQPFKTGFKFLDKTIGGYYPGELTAICGGSNSGKTAFVITQLNLLALEQGVPTLFIKSGMSETSLIGSMAAYYCAIQSTNVHSVLKSAAYHDEVEAYLQKLSQAPLYVIDGTPYEGSLLERVEELVKTKHIKMVFFDEVDIPLSDSEPPLALQKLAQRLNVGVVAVFTSYNFEPRPRLRDMDIYCGFHETDTVLGFIDYEQGGTYSDINGKDLRGMLEIAILKHRGILEQSSFRLPKQSLYLRDVALWESTLERMRNDSDSVGKLIASLDLEIDEDDIPF